MTTTLFPKKKKKIMLANGYACYKKIMAVAVKNFLKTVLTVFLKFLCGFLIDHAMKADWGQFEIVKGSLSCKGLEKYTSYDFQSRSVFSIPKFWD